MIVDNLKGSFPPATLTFKGKMRILVLLPVGALLITAVCMDSCVGQDNDESAAGGKPCISD